MWKDYVLVVTLCIVVTPILDSPTLTAAFSHPSTLRGAAKRIVPRNPQQKPSPHSSLSQSCGSSYICGGQSDVIVRHISGSHMQHSLVLNARLSLTLQRIPHSQDYVCPWYSHIIRLLAGTWTEPKPDYHNDQHLSRMEAALPSCPFRLNCGLGAFNCKSNKFPCLSLHATRPLLAQRLPMGPIQQNRGWEFDYNSPDRQRLSPRLVHAVR